MARNVIHAGFARELLEKVEHRRRRAGDAMTDCGEFLKTLWISGCRWKVDV
jgi:hypothetical protein